jgi:nitrogen fixation/metabolism regulation signal transduction histidine kinase
MASKTVKRFRLGGLSVVLLLLVLLVSLHLMSSAVQNSAALSRYFVPLLVVNLLGMFILLSLIGFNTVRLIHQYVRHRAGSRLTLRMVIIFVLISLAPVGVVYYYSFSFLQGGIDSWFDVKIDQAMDDARDLGQASLDLNQRILLKYTEQLLHGIEDASETALSLTVAELRQQSGALEMSLTDDSGQVIAYSNALAEELTPSKPDDFILQQLRDGQSYVGLMREDDDLMVRVVVPDPSGRPLALLGIYPTSERVGALSDKLELAYNRFKELSFLRQSLKRNFSLTLFLVLMFGVLFAVWAAFFSAQRMVAPITSIAEGTREVAQGNYDRQLPIPKRADELAFLVASFNAMTRRIAQARDQADRSQREVEGQRAYLETVLDRLSSGVLTIDASSRLRTANPTAERILDIELQNLGEQRSLDELADRSPTLSQFFDALSEALVSSKHEWRGELTLKVAGVRKVLTCVATPFAQPDGQPGHIVLFDDITALISAQRNAAWGEVARRLAHEIKNPLTPIQLAAERMRRKYLKSMPEESADVLDRATHTIVQQVEAMKRMVNEFSEYARPPKMELQVLEGDLLIMEIMDLYRNGENRGSFNLQLNAPGVVVEVDPLRIRQMVHNLVKNAQEALVDREDGMLLVCSRSLHEGDGKNYEVCFEDNGPGFNDEMIQHLFEPYVTNKHKGTGLGLAIVKKIVEEHGGSIWAENSDNGAVVIVRLPVYSAVEEQNE